MITRGEFFCKSVRVEYVGQASCTRAVRTMESSGGVSSKEPSCVHVCLRVASVFKAMFVIACRSKACSPIKAMLVIVCRLEVAVGGLTRIKAMLVFACRLKACGCWRYE